MEEKELISEEEFMKDIYAKFEKHVVDDLTPFGLKLRIFYNYTLDSSIRQLDYTITKIFILIH